MVSGGRQSGSYLDSTNPGHPEYVPPEERQTWGSFPVTLLLVAVAACVFVSPYCDSTASRVNGERISQESFLENLKTVE